MKVVIQRPAFGEPGSKHPAYLNAIFEADLRPLESGSGWHVLQSLRPRVGESPDPETPVLHRGFFDSHLHMIWMGLYELDLDLRPTASLDEALVLVAKKLRDGAPFVRGYGWDESRWGMSLEAIARACEARLPEGKPVLLYRVCGHAALVNQTLRRQSRREPLPVLVTDKDFASVVAQIPPPGQATCEEAFLRSQAKVIAQGITAVGDMSLDETTVAAIRNLTEQGKLLIDVTGVIEARRAPSIENTGPLIQRNSNAVGPLDRPASLSVQHWKKYLDGSLGSRTAWLTRPYADSDRFGDSLCDTKDLTEAARGALREGFHLSFHVIGDAALDQALEVGDKLGPLMRARLESPSSSLFKTAHRLEHAQVVRDDQLERLRSQGFWVVSTQPHHRLGDRSFIHSRLGPERYRGQAYRAASFTRGGIPLALSSDGPVDRIDPPSVMFAAMTHENPAERLSFYDALWWYTTGGRLALGVDPGKLAPGSTVFLTAPLACP